EAHRRATGAPRASPAALPPVAIGGRGRGARGRQGAAPVSLWRPITYGSLSSSPEPRNACIRARLGRRIAATAVVLYLCRQFGLPRGGRFGYQDAAYANNGPTYGKRLVIVTMALSHKLEFRQTQSLVMTPQLLQAIKLLQLSNLDLI